ncbi:MAG: hypothetical protein FGM15_04805 [Chthoniobacterales bacterium]|nr:hypothetical protein [Chthoniobacterales bacterium]
MTPEEIKKQMMGSAGISHGARPVSPKTNIKMVTETDSNGQPANPDVISKWVRTDATQGELKYIVLESNDCRGLTAAPEEHAEFMQAAAMPEGAVPPEGFDLQYREGTGNEHFSVPRLVSREELEQALLKYAADDKSFKTDFEWQKLPQDEDQTESNGEALPARNEAKTDLTAEPPKIKPSHVTSMPLAIVLAVLFGPFGLLYVSWKRALVMLVLFIVGVSLIPNNGFVTLLFWLVAPVVSIFALGAGSRQTPPA